MQTRNLTGSYSLFFNHTKKKIIYSSLTKSIDFSVADNGILSLKRPDDMKGFLHFNMHDTHRRTVSESMGSH